MPNRRSFLRSAFAAPLLSNAAVAQEPHADPLPGLPRLDDPAYWSKIRDQFPLSRDKVFFNNGTIGAMPTVVVNRMVEHIQKIAADVAEWDYRGPEWIGGYGDYPALRGKMAKLLNADEKEISLTENNTCSMSYVASGLDLPADAEILITDQEHPGGQSPWLNTVKRRGGVVTKMTIPKPIQSADEVLDIVKRSITPRT